MKKRIVLFFTIIFVICTESITSAMFESTQVHFIDTGQSDCTLIKSGSTHILIDTGQAYYTNRILKYLRLNKINSLDGIIITHYHDDHYDGLLKIAQTLKVNKVYLPNNKNNIKHNLSKALSKFDTQVRYIDNGWKIKYPKLNLTAIGPVNKDINHINSNSRENNNSIVLQGKIGSHTYLFAGDCEKSEEDDMIKSGKLKKCDIMKVPHHGINTSTGIQFLKKTKPKIAVITSNSKTPNSKVVSRLLKKKITVLKTNDQGTVTVSENTIFCSKNNIKIKVK